MNDAVLIDDHADVDDEKKIDEVRINLRVKKALTLNFLTRWWIFIKVVVLSVCV